MNVTNEVATEGGSASQRLAGDETSIGFSFTCSLPQ